MTITTTPFTDIQIVDLPSAFPNAEQASYAWAQHRGITDSPILGYAVLSTDLTGQEDEPVTVVTTFSVTDYAAATAFVRQMVRIERDAMIQFHDYKAHFAFRTANIYDFGGKPTIVL